MREILFRAKSVWDGEWLYGDYSHSTYDNVKIRTHGRDIDGLFLVDPETVGQYTGMTDGNDEKIFEGDIVMGVDSLVPELKVFGYIGFENGSFVIIGDLMTHYRWLDYDVKVIGNIHDNPELLEE